VKNLTKSFPLELKALKERQFEGHGSVFGNVDLGGDMVVSGAFKRTLTEHKEDGRLPQMFWMHQMDRVPGKWTDMEEDEKGLYVKGELADTELGNEMHTLMQMKAVRGLSIGYSIVERDYNKEGVRLIKDVDLWEVSIVSLAMNPMASVTNAKSRLSKDFEFVPHPHEFKRDLEEHLRDVGCARSVAKRLVSKMFDRDDSPGEMPEDVLREAAGDPTLTDEEKAVMASILNVTSKVGAASLPTVLFK